MAVNKNFHKTLRVTENFDVVFVGVSISTFFLHIRALQKILFTGMGREVDNLIKENTELLETKNALNIVKNDLIAQLDQISRFASAINVLLKLQTAYFSENDVLQEELRTIEMLKIKQADKIRELEGDLKTLREKANADEQEEQVCERKFSSSSLTDNRAFRIFR